MYNLFMVKKDEFILLLEVAKVKFYRRNVGQGAKRHFCQRLE